MRCDDVYIIGNIAGISGHGRQIAGTARNNDIAGVPIACVGRDLEQIAGFPYQANGATRLNRRLSDQRVLIDKLDDLGHRHESIGIAARICVPRQSALPVRRQQPQRIPALVAPGVGDLAALEHDVLDGTLAQAMTDGQPGMAGTDDEHVDGASRLAVCF